MKKIFDEKSIATLLLNYTTLCGNLQLQAMTENKDHPELLQTSMTVAEHEAMIRTFAAMIEENNQALLAHLEHLGILSND
jgi:hypothetical protein